MPYTDLEDEAQRTFPIYTPFLSGSRDPYSKILCGDTILSRKGLRSCA